MARHNEYSFKLASSIDNYQFGDGRFGINKCEKASRAIMSESICDAKAKLANPVRLHKQVNVAF